MKPRLLEPVLEGFLPCTLRLMGVRLSSFRDQKQMLLKGRLDWNFDTFLQLLRKSISDKSKIKKRYFYIHIFIHISYIPPPSKGCQLNPKGWFLKTPCNGPMWHPKWFRSRFIVYTFFISEISTLGPTKKVVIFAWVIFEKVESTSVNIFLPKESKVRTLNMEIFF